MGTELVDEEVRLAQKVQEAEQNLQKFEKRF